MSLPGIHRPVTDYTNRKEDASKLSLTSSPLSVQGRGGGGASIISAAQTLAVILSWDFTYS